MPATDMPTAVLEKIRSEDLRQEAVAAASHPHTVIVELDLPYPQVQKISPDPRSAFGTPKFRLSPPSEGTSEIDRRVADTQSAIERIIGRPPESFFSTSGSFVVVANGEQLRHIAKLPSVSAIWPNTQRRRTALG